MGLPGVCHFTKLYTPRYIALIDYCYFRWNRFDALLCEPRQEILMSNAFGSQDVRNAWLPFPIHKGKVLAHLHR